MKIHNSHLPSLRHSIALGLFSIFPNIRLVALCNSRAMGEHSKNSDIDLFIITKPGRIWTVRFITVFITTLLGIRIKNPHGLKKGSKEYIHRTKNKFCLSFFITEDAMNLDNIRIENDLYLDKWIQTLIPLINKNGTLERFLEANSGEKCRARTDLTATILHSRLEHIIKTLWLPKTLKTYEKLGKPWGIIISDTMLKFHANDQRKVYRDTHSVNEIDF